MTETLRVLIADDHTIVRSGVRMLLETEPNLTVVGEALTGAQAVDLARTLKPDLILMDISMPEMDGLEATRQIKAGWPEINILVLTMHRSDEYFFEILKAGASGYILKTADTEELIQAVRATARGDVFLMPSMAKKLLGSYLSQVKEEPEAIPLSAREKEILQLLAQGYSNKEIASKLVVSPSTVHTHRNNIMKKLGLSTRRELIQYANERGII
jgi:two-component system, NarL family, response regulator NreC